MQNILILNHILPSITKVTNKWHKNQIVPIALKNLVSTFLQDTFRVQNSIWLMIGGGVLDVAPHIHSMQGKSGKLATKK